MANRHYKGNDEQNAFVEVDLLPEMRRPRAFNVNILLIVLVAVFFTWLLIYLPLNNRQDTLDATLETNNDLTNELTLVSEIVERYDIDRERIVFQGQLAMAESLQSEYADNLEALNQGITAVEPDGQILEVTYNAVENKFELIIRLGRQISFQNVNIEFLEEDFVVSSTYDDPEPISGSSRYLSTYTIEVKSDAVEESE